MGQTDLFGNEIDPSRTMTVDLFSDWLDELAPSSFWADGYELLRARGVRHRYAALATWLSLGRDDRGDLQTRDDFANFMGVARQTTYDWEDRRPVREWAEMLRVLRMRGARLANVDERTYRAAVGDESSARDRELYYKRASVWEDQQRVTLVGDEEEAPVQQTVSFDVNALPVEVLRALADEREGGEA
jgi:DNA-binding XRE family transcriptional regulator